jgi:hypothetical protein
MICPVVMVVMLVLVVVVVAAAMQRVDHLSGPNQSIVCRVSARENINERAGLARVRVEIEAEWRQQRAVVLAAFWVGWCRNLDLVGER